MRYPWNFTSWKPPMPPENEPWMCKHKGRNDIVVLYRVRSDMYIFKDSIPDSNPHWAGYAEDWEPLQPWIDWSLPIEQFVDYGVKAITLDQILEKVRVLTEHGIRYRIGYCVYDEDDNKVPDPPNLLEVYAQLDTSKSNWPETTRELPIDVFGLVQGNPIDQEGRLPSRIMVYPDSMYIETKNKKPIICGKLKDGSEKSTQTE